MQLVAPAASWASLRRAETDLALGAGVALGAGYTAVLSLALGACERRDRALVTWQWSITQGIGTTVFQVEIAPVGGVGDWTCGQDGEAPVTMTYPQVGGGVKVVMAGSSIMECNARGDACTMRMRALTTVGTATANAGECFLRCVVFRGE